MQKRPHPITYPKLVQCQACVSGSGCGRAGGEQWEVSACSCPVICFSCQDLLNKQPVHQVGISHVQGGFSLNLSRWECFLLQGSYLMFTLPKDHNRHLCANIRRHNLCPKHLMVWACRRPGVSLTDVTEVTGSCLSRCSHFPSNSVSLYIYFGTVVSGREGARDCKHQDRGHEAGERCWWETESKDQQQRRDWSRIPSARKTQSLFDFWLSSLIFWSCDINWSREQRLWAEQRFILVFSSFLPEVTWLLLSSWRSEVQALLVRLWKAKRESRSTSWMWIMTMFWLQQYRNKDICRDLMSLS